MIGWGATDGTGTGRISTGAHVFDFTTAGTVYGNPTATRSAICPDLLRYEQIGEADNMRGRLVRAFFSLMRLWPTR